MFAGLFGRRLDPSTVELTFASNPGGLQLAVRGGHVRVAPSERFAPAGSLGAALSAAGLDEIAKLIDSGGLRPVVDQTYPFDEAPQALAHVEGGRTKGKVVITTV